MKLMRTLKWLIVRLIMQMKCRTSLMRNHEALSLGRSYPDNMYKDLQSFGSNCKDMSRHYAFIFSLVMKPKIPR